MSTLEVLRAIQNSAFAHLLSKSDHMVGAALQVIHVLGFVLLLAALLLVSLRLLGLVFTQHPAPLIVRDGSRLIWIGFGLAAASGVLMFIASPQQYFFNTAFEWKMLLLLVALIVQLLLFRGAATRAALQPRFARVSAILSLSAWFSIAVAGRLIAFV